MCARGVASARGVLESFVLIGALTALWRACGAVSEVVVLATPLVRPAVAPLAVFCMCSLMSFLIGTSFGTAATMGVSIALAALVCAAARRMSAGQIASVCVLGFTPRRPHRRRADVGRRSRLDGQRLAGGVPLVELLGAV